jgi:hypothetical protein
MGMWAQCSYKSEKVTATETVSVFNVAINYNKLHFFFNSVFISSTFPLRSTERIITLPSIRPLPAQPYSYMNDMQSYLPWQ